MVRLTSTHLRRYTGKSLFERLGGTVPVGLLVVAVGGSPIEYWLPPRAGDPANVNPCESDRPQCDNQYNDSVFYDDNVQQLLPYTIGAIVWDQAERDVKCPVSTAAYPCMQAYLVDSWRAAFRSPSAPFVAVQLPGYTGALNNGTGTYPGGITAGMVFAMRLAQGAGAAATANASIVATYDLSCPTSPYGSVHNVEKGPIGSRIAAQLFKALGDAPHLVVDGPRAVGARVVGARRRAAATAAASSSSFEIAVTFAGGSAPFTARGTKNCTACCGGVHTLDFSAGGGGRAWVNATHATVDRASGKVTFHVEAQRPPTRVRYTGSAIFPQCALYNTEGLPALPFEMAVEPMVL